MTVTMYIPSCFATTSKSEMEMIFPQMRQAMPMGEYLRRGAAQLRPVNCTGQAELQHRDGTYHMIALTRRMTISLRTLKKSNISFAFSPIFPIMTPKATKNPIRPEHRGKSNQNRSEAATEGTFCVV